ncbi:MAG: polyphosphate:AMP phosphotransferase [Lentisphaerales bacterium]|nr:polyphosphate:AMP phosphotransferase [Lentisphaerales bacterium]
MLHKIDLSKKISRQDYKKERDVLELELIKLQRRILDQGIPVIIAFEGLSTAGKGMLINELCIPMDPRGYRVFDSISRESDITALTPFWINSPAKGFVSIFDKSCFRTAFEESFHKGEVSKELLDNAKNFVQHHLNSDTLVIKFFIHISQQEQSRRLQKLCADKDTEWRVNRSDLFQNVHYDKYVAAASSVLVSTNSPSPWVIVEADDEYHARLKVLKTVVKQLQERLKKPVNSSGNSLQLASMKTKSHFQNIDMSATLGKADYKKEFKKYGEKLRSLGHKLFKQKVPAVLVFEGWDAAGKGGAIRRLSRFFDPRNFRVCPIAAPSTIEKNHNYLWRFSRELPIKGDLVVFDRSWYGRVLVERVEGYCRPDDWKRAYAEINAFEEHLVENGVVLMKFWLEVSPEEQLRRFNQRLEIPHKNWKITDEDWRNREKWPVYRDAVDEMVCRTSTEKVPWTIVEGDCKQFARVKVLKTVSKVIKQRLKEL